MSIKIGMVIGAIGVVVSPGQLAAAAETTAARAAARGRIKAEQLRDHVETLASDSFEGREAGRRGGTAASVYIMRALKRSGLRPAGVDGTYFQSFGPGYRNVLALVRGNHDQLRREYVIVSAHFDHVGYGTRRNSNGPVGYIHNGADDNASGVATLLEVAEALQAEASATARSVLFVFWDAEEKGLLGSTHWLNDATVDLDRVRLMINADMVGRLRGTVSLVGTRSMAGLRGVWSRANALSQLQLRFPWAMLDNSDHYPFFQRRIPVTMVHTGLHDDYHRPSDDAHKVNVDGIATVSRLLLNFIVEVANLPKLEPFRIASLGETADDQRHYERPAARQTMRLGVSWDSNREPHRGVLIKTVWAGSAAERAGLRVRDRVVGINQLQITNAAELRRFIVTAPETVQLEVERDGATEVLDVALDGSPVRVGISWRTSDAEPGVVMLSSVVAGSPAAEAGLRRLDRVHAVAGQTFESSEQFRQVMLEAEAELDLLIERGGRMRQILLTLPPS